MAAVRHLVSDGLTGQLGRTAHGQDLSRGGDRSHGEG